MRLRFSLVLPLAYLLVSCGQGDPADPSATVTEQDRAYGAQQHPQLLAEFGGAYPGEEAVYVRQVGDRVATEAGLQHQCTFTLVNSDVVNAFAVPGCYIYVTRGLFAVITSEAELASVLGHELGHVVARHAQRQNQRSLWRNLGVIATSVTGSERLTRLAGQAAQYFGLRYSRRQEYEADDFGVEYLRRAGYDVFAASEMLAALQRQEAFMIASGGRDAARAVPEWALSHPLTEHRIERARIIAENTGLKDNELPEEADRYMREVDGLLYGDDPEQGFVTGRRFAHPIMRISFEAPPGFSLTNSPRAIRLSGPNGIAGEFGGGTMPPQGLQAYSQALVGQVLGDVPAQVESALETSINGVPAILIRIRVAVRDGTVPVSIATYNLGNGRASRFVIASPPADTDAAAVTALFRSFRRLSASEAASLRPRFIRTVRVATGQSLDTIVSQVDDPAPRALFQALNGAEAGQAVRPGDLVKIVTYADGR